ncbi:carboxypeptidase-like regulatory domain-containing protein [uncultured Sunxiuqinia sp.]|uniref:TonB-dependent receptor n=1 Tax=uncultured Sunxiuqinia sp. TaxID=1573825 RepID=UPI002AA899F1|nr:carboxypeptidase-like regulatory domain-containing protein [uncultured Sunxiuqinia sp.]
MTKNNLLLFAVFLFVCTFNISAQTLLSGVVRDSKTMEPIPGVNIVVKETQKGTVTNQDGKYQLTLSSINCTILFSSVGYESIRKKVSSKDDKTTLNISMEELVTQINEVKVTGKTKAREIREKAMPVSVISVQQLQGTVNSIQDVLTKTVGVTIRSSGGVGSASRLSVRGLEGKRIGFFIEETPLNDQSDFIDLNDIPIDMIERIEIYKGVVPAKFGGSSMGGAVNIVLKEYPDRYGDFSYTLESFNTHKIQTILKRNHKEKGIVFGVGGGYTYADNDYTMESPHIKGLKIKRNHDKFKKILIGGAFEATKWWFDEVEFEPVFLDTYREIQGIETDIREALIKSRAYILANSLQKTDFFAAGLDLDMSTAIAYTQYGLTDTAKVWYDWYGNSYPTTSPYGGELGTRYASDSDNKKFTLMNKLNLEYLINEQHSINFNSFFNLANGNPENELRELSLGRKTVFDSKMRSWVGGVTYDFRTRDDKFLNSFTTRYYLYTMYTKNSNIYGIGEIEDISLSQSDIGISNALRYRFRSDLLGKFSAGYDVRIPSETELLGDGYSITAAEDLLPERNTNINLGLLYDRMGKGTNNLQLEIGMYYMYLENMIRFTKGFLGAQYQNFGEMRTLGIEAEAKADIVPWLYGYANVTFQDLRDARKYKENSTVVNPTKDKRMPNIPYFLANAGLEFHKANLFGGNGQNTRIFSDVSFIEEYYYDFEVTTNAKRRIPRSLSVDVGFEHSFLFQRLFVSGKVKNLTDERVLSEFNRPLPGRSFGIKLRYLFSSNGGQKKIRKENMN